MCRLDAAVLPGVDAGEGPAGTDMAVGTEQQVLVKVKPIESRKPWTECPTAADDPETLDAATPKHARRRERTCGSIETC